MHSVSLQRNEIPFTLTIMVFIFTVHIYIINTWFTIVTHAKLARLSDNNHRLGGGGVGGRGQAPPIILEGDQHTLWTPSLIHRVQNSPQL